MSGVEAGLTWVNPPMTVRQWYKGLAMQGFIGNGKDVHYGHLARWSSLAADAMIAEDIEHERSTKEND